MQSISEYTLKFVESKQLITFFQSRRHLLRLWLRDEELAWSIPEALNETWRRLYYSTPIEKQTFPFEAEIRKGSKGGGKY